MVIFTQTLGHFKYMVRDGRTEWKKKWNGRRRSEPNGLDGRNLSYGDRFVFVMVVAPSDWVRSVRIPFVSAVSPSYHHRKVRIIFGATLIRTLKTARIIRIDSETFGLGSFCDRIEFGSTPRSHPAPKVRSTIGLSSFRSDPVRFGRFTFVSPS